MSMHEQESEFFEDVSNPLDSVEDMLSGQDWAFERPHTDELSVTIVGRHAPYRMTFLWQEDYSAMQFFCEFDLSIPSSRRAAAAQALQMMNAGLWLGHFVINNETGAPTFRHTSMFRGQTQSSGAELVEDLVDIAVAECDRYFAAFNMLSCTPTHEDGLMTLALADAGGEA
jgi:hypothetical protein